jgi:hypothetical protein
MRGRGMPNTWGMYSYIGCGTGVYNDRAWRGDGLMTVWNNNIIIILERSFCISIHLPVYIIYLYRLWCTLQCYIYIYIIHTYTLLCRNSTRSNPQSTKSPTSMCRRIHIIIIVFVIIIRGAILWRIEKARVHVNVVIIIVLMSIYIAVSACQSAARVMRQLPTPHVPQPLQPHHRNHRYRHRCIIIEEKKERACSVNLSDYIYVE